MKKNIFNFSFLFLILFSLTIFSVPAQAQDENEPENYVSIKVFADKTKMISGEIVRVGIEQTIYPDWHTYWINPGDSGLAFDVEWDLPEGFSVSPLEWPTPNKIPYAGLTNYGYSDQVVLLQNLAVPDNISNDPITIKGKANILVCHDICVPETHDIQITLNGDDVFDPADIEKADSKLPTLTNNEAVYFEQDGNFIIDISEKISDLNGNNIYIAPIEWGLINNNETATIAETDNGYRIIQKRGERVLSEVQNYEFVLATNKDDKSYFLTATPKIVEQVATGAPIALHQETAPPKEAPFTFMKAVMFALLGGLILNLMPCVFPVLSIKALSLVKLGDREESKARLYGLSYTAGILISFGLIAGLLIALKSFGAQIGWGFQLQNPIFIALLIYLIFIIGLNLAGFFEFKNSLGNVGQKFASQSGNRGAFFTGILATIVATPCTAPFMGAAMGYALTQGAFVAIIIFLSLGFGLALPYLALCFFPPLRRKLPKPGLWMVKFKEFLSFPMFLTAAYLVWVLSQQAGAMSVLLVLSILVAIVFVLWLRRNIPVSGMARYISIFTFVITLGLIIVTPFLLKTQKNVTMPDHVNEQAFSTAKLNELLAGNDAIFTNMTAAWCITCKVNERTSIATKEVQNIFARKNIQYLKGDWTNQNPEITQYLNSYNRQGVPLYVFYGARDSQTGNRPDPIVLPQILTPSLIEKTIQ